MTEHHIKGWLIATAAGGLAVAIYYAIGFVFGAQSDAVSLSDRVTVLAATWVVATIIVNIGLIVVGLPLTFLLRDAQKETVGAYGAVGAVAGFLIPVVMNVCGGGHPFEELILVHWSLPASLGGAVTALLWGRCRKLALAIDAEGEQCAPNRIDDPRILR